MKLPQPCRNHTDRALENLRLSTSRFSDRQSSSFFCALEPWCRTLGKKITQHSQEAETAFPRMWIRQCYHPQLWDHFCWELPTVFSRLERPCFILTYSHSPETKCSIVMVSQIQLAILQTQRVFIQIFPQCKEKTCICRSPCTFHSLAETSVSQNQEETGKPLEGLTWQPLHNRLEVHLWTAVSDN